MLKRSKRALINTLIDNIIIDKNINISVKFKYEVTPEINFMYEKF